jgi:hypothetical protein
VDAICIDQDNILERGHQVKQMGEIYSYAGTVLTWLGLHSNKFKEIKAAELELLDLGQIAKALTSSQDQSVDLGYFVEKAQDVLQHGSEAFVAFTEIYKLTY